MNELIGKPVDRVDGRLKVTGQARYSAEVPVANMVYGVLVGSTVAKGRIASIDTQVAEHAAGVLYILTYLNMPKLGKVEMFPTGPAMETHLPLQDDRIYHSGQHIALVIAETLEQAEYAASLVRVSYTQEQAVPLLADALPAAYVPKQASGKSLDSTRGNPQQAFKQAEVRLDATYSTPIEHHNPIEAHSTTAVWNGDHLTIYEGTQWVAGSQRLLTTMLGIPQDNIRIISSYVGGAFGCKASLWSHTPLAVVAARAIRRPVKLQLTRAQMFTSTGYRPATVQRVRLGATRDGQLTAIIHNATAQTSATDDFIEAAIPTTTQMLYACSNLEITYRLARVNAATPTVMRAPGEGVCLFAIDSAMDELAYKLKIDPLKLRLRNYADVDPESGHPWSSKSLKECYRQAAERFGWSRRNPQPRSMRDGRYLIGWGMATATYPVFLSPAAARVRLFADGSALAQSGTHELGTGAYTVHTQIAAEALGLPVERVRFELGDTSLPKTPVSGGSRSTASVGPAVQAAATAARNEAVKLALADKASPLYGYAEADVAVEGGRMFLKRDPSKGETYAQLLTRRGMNSVEAYRETMPPGATNTDKTKVFGGLNASRSSSNSKFAMHSFGAQFCEVRVDPDLGTVRVTRFVGAFGAGRIINQKTAESQIKGAIVGGIGMALLEETITDRKRGRIINANLGEYHVPVNADVPEIDAFFMDEDDPHIGALGAKGVGEIGIVGVAAAIANAVFHATGKRIRSLPITLDKVF